MIESVLLWVLAVLTAPLFAGIIFKVKAFFGGRKGSPVLINYYTLIKLFKKGSVYSTSTTYIFRLGPLVILGSAATVLLFLPIAGHAPVLTFNGDVIFILYLLGLADFSPLPPPWTPLHRSRAWARPEKPTFRSSAKPACS
jgi:formate hydrogenlyase subunit 4